MTKPKPKPIPSHNLTVACELSQIIQLLVKEEKLSLGWGYTNGLRFAVKAIKRRLIELEHPCPACERGK